MRKGSVAIQQSQQDVRVDFSATDQTGVKSMSMMEAGDDAAVARKRNNFKDKDFTGNVELVIDETSRAVEALARK